TNDVSSFDWNGEQNIFHIVSTSTPTALTISELMNKSGQDEDIIDAITGLSCSWTTQTSNC
ncbi:hypothetical protein ACLKA6_017269, partial [Drosophila palustris]